MCTIINIHRLDKDNVGDLNCSPVQYFKFLSDAAICDIRDTSRLNFGDKDIIFGGGGILYPPYRDIMEKIALKSKGRLISWGIGHNEHFLDASQQPVFEYPDFMKLFKLNGIRDFGQKFDWVPDVSCMHKGFDKKRVPTREFVIYEHPGFSIHIPGIDKMYNSVSSMDEALDFLGSAETIITNTYHGMCWAILLKRKVIVFPFSTRFLASKYAPQIYPDIKWIPCLLDDLRRDKKYFCVTKGWDKLVKKCVVYDEALEDCRNTNIKYALKVSDLLNGKR